MARFEKGKPRHPNAGRKKGSLNRNRNILEDLDRVTLNGEPVNLVELLMTGIATMPPYQQVDAIIDFMKFVFPQKKHIEREDVTPPEDREAQAAKLKAQAEEKAKWNK